MTKPIRRACVVGAGVMGSGIAAHLANAGIEVLLLDIVPPNLTDAERTKKSARDRFAAGGLDKALKAKPAAFFHPSCARLVSVGNTEDDLGKLANVDLVIEAVLEKIEVKRDLFAKLEAVIGAETIIASNTSGLRIHDMLEGRSESFKQRFLVMHFFNPVRYMKLLEIVVGPDTSEGTLAAIKKLGTNGLGKGVVLGKDTPNFVGNRIGAHSMMATTHQMLADGFSPEDVDAITGVPMGHPKSASFKTADIVGLDTFSHVSMNCFNALTDDEDRDVFAIPPFLSAMIEKKLLGDKTKSGFYRKSKDGLETFDPTTLAYRPNVISDDVKAATKALSKIEDVRARVKALVATEGKVGAFAWKALSRSLAYSARRIPEITDSVVAIDEAMRWGYNWELGPFETWDALGFRETTARMKKEGVALPASIDAMLAAGAESFYTADGRVWDLVKGAYVAREVDPRNLTLATARKGTAPVLRNGGAEAWDLGDGVLGVTYTTKANSLDGDVMKMLTAARERAEQDFRAMVIVNEGDHFSVGANLFMIVMAAQQKQWDVLRGTVKSLHDCFQGLKYSQVPVIAAPFGMALGGGLEVCLASSGVQAGAETYAGLVEVGVGIIPGGAGNLNLLWRALENTPEGQTVDTYAVVTQVFKNIALAQVSSSALDAKHKGFFRHSDGISYDRARHLAEAKARAIGLADSGYHAPAPRAYRLPGESGIATLGMMIDTLVAGGQATEHDALIARKLAGVLCGGLGGASREVTEAEMLELECEAFLSLAGEQKSQERMQHMLMKNKPLRN